MKPRRCLLHFPSWPLAARKRAVHDWEVSTGESSGVGTAAHDDDGDYTTFVEGTELDVAAAKASMEAAAADLERRKEALLRELALE